MRKGKRHFGSLLTELPATFMIEVGVTYILMAKEGFRLDQTASYIVGVAVVALLLVIYLTALIRKNRRVKV